MFVTSTQYAGAVGGLAAADAYCQASADGAGLQGTFRAWLSDAKTNAYDRIDDVGPWYSTADKEAFASKAALRGAPGAPLLDENGGYPSSAGAWSGTDASGVATGQDCDDWTNATSAVSATAGSTFVGDTSWGGGDAPLACDGKAPLICFEQ